MILNKLCGPALIYVIFSIIHIIIDTHLGRYQNAIVKLSISLLFTLLLQLLCMKGLGIVSWIIVFLPFIFYTYMVSIILFVFGTNPEENDKIKEYEVN
mgnify:CR=1 FL=1|tara:strand:+ start:361 stop:654 length:294 start_codon:yes stop_codon:yes gene_type:complete